MSTVDERGWVLAVHGGASEGPMRLSNERLEVSSRGLTVALDRGAEVLADQGSAVDAVVEAVKVLEDDPLFNAGRGSVLTAAGTVETDAGVADGNLRRAGAVAACRGVRNPVEAARAVMERTEHVLLAGQAVAEMAAQWGLETEAEEWFVTARALAQHRRLQQAAGPSSTDTVGAVARDRRGHLAAATSTGGRLGKLPGRVGDSPLVGAGIWADDSTCAVSATGRGEAFILAAFAHEVDALVRLSGLDIGGACERALELVSARGGLGGCVAVDAAGTLVLPFTGPGMFRGWTDSSGRMFTAVLPDG